MPLHTEKKSELIDKFLALNAESPDSLSKRGLPIDSSVASVQTFRRRIADDYRLLGGSRARLAAFAGPTPSTDPTERFGDRPFVKERRPEQGFLTMPRDVLVALTDVGLTWGAIDFGRASGDVMHIDCRQLGC